MIYILQDEKIDPLVLDILIYALLILCFFAIVKHLFNFIEEVWVKYISPKPIYRHFYLRKYKLTKDQIFILQNEFSFYQNLSRRQQVYFQYRVAKFIKLHKFEGRSGLYINDRKRVLISATAIMLTFGYRDYLLNSLDRILIYPGPFYSKLNKARHKGEFNPAYKAIILSWKDFVHGYSIENDNFNLGIHEMVHAMHFDYLRQGNKSINALLFTRYYRKLKKFLKTNKHYRQNLVKSRYLRNYAFTNRFEFIAVLIESFFETPKELKSEFPEIYDYVKKMLNFGD